MQYRHTKRAHSYAFRSLAELARYLVDTPRTWSSASSEKNSSGASWDLGCPYSRAVTLAANGWIEGAERAQQALKALALKTPHKETRYDFYGFRPAVARYCAGAPDSMVRTASNPYAGFGRVLTLYIPCNALAGVSAQHMANFGLGVAQYLNQLETDGVRVEIHGAICSLVSGSRVTHTWCIKSADQPLDLAVLAFSIGHPAMFRRLGFALRERCAARQDWGYGSTVPLALSDVIDAPVGAYVLNGMAQASRIARTPQDALEYITAQLDKLIDQPDAA